MPVLAARGGVVLLGEQLTLRLRISALAILGAVLRAIVGRGTARAALRAPTPLAATPTHP